MNWSAVRAMTSVMLTVRIRRPIVLSAAANECGGRFLGLLSLHGITKVVIKD